MLADSFLLWGRFNSCQSCINVVWKVVALKSDTLQNFKDGNTGNAITASATNCEALDDI